VKRESALFQGAALALLAGFLVLFIGGALYLLNAVLFSTNG
jgi:hypothetical protein